MAEIRGTNLGPEDGGNFEHSWSNDYLQAHFISDVGKKRKHNEDSCVLCIPADTFLAAERGRIFAVADGMGGASAGEYASRLALETLIEVFYSGDSRGIPIQLRDSIEQANTRIFSEALENAKYHGMGTTMSAMLVLGDCLYVGQVGDSRVYLLRSNTELKQITHDHSLVAEQVRTGLISEEEARNHAFKNLITRAVGIKEDVEVDLFSTRLKKDDTLLVCSDGLNNMVEDTEVADCLMMDNLQGAARVLVGKALEGGGTDNITVGLVRVKEAPPHADMEAGCDDVPFPSTGFFGKLKQMLSPGS